MNESSRLIQTAHDELFSWCQRHDFAGHDPFDALNSQVFQATPLAQSRNARFIWTQLVKRSPFDLRSVARVPAERNAKGIALFALAQLAKYRRDGKAESKRQAESFLSQLLSMRIEGYAGACWGYNFDWQSRNFFAPRGMPTIVPTAFAARALIEATHDSSNEYLRAARSVCDFILQDLPRTVETESELCFSYAPNTNTRIFNASLLAAEVLASVGNLTGERELIVAAERAARYVINNQRADGSWTYGADPKQSWIDNFHTAYVLFSLKRLGLEFQPAVERGYQYLEEQLLSCGGLAEILP